jgi:hypothetical protein
MSKNFKEDLFILILRELEKKVKDQRVKKHSKTKTNSKKTNNLYMKTALI